MVRTGVLVLRFYHLMVVYDHFRTPVRPIRRLQKMPPWQAKGAKAIQQFKSSLLDCDRKASRAAKNGCATLVVSLIAPHKVVASKSLRNLHCLSMRICKDEDVNSTA